jgi:hypothetical protein
MRGSPPIQLFLLVLAFGLAGVVLTSLTQYEVKQGPKVPRKVERSKMKLRLSWAGKLEKLSLKHEERELASGVDLSGDEAEIKVEAEVAKTGIELFLDAKWADGTPKTALSVEVEPDGYEARIQTRWSTDAAMNEVLVFTW